MHGIGTALRVEGMGWRTLWEVRAESCQSGSDPPGFAGTLQQQHYGDGPLHVLGAHVWGFSTSLSCPFQKACGGQNSGSRATRAGIGET